MNQFYLSLTYFSFCFSSCFYHPLWKPYFFPDNHTHSKQIVQYSTIFFLIQPRIWNLSASSGVEGEVIVIEGANFSSDINENKVFFADSLPAEIIEASGSRLAIKVPFGAKSGRITIQNQFGMTQSPDRFTVYRYFISFSAGSNTELYSLNMVTGELVSNSLSPFAFASNNAKFTNNGRFAYSGGFGISYISSYSVNSLNGVLSSLSANAGTTTSNPVFFAFHPSNRFLYVSNINGASVSAFQLDENTGILGKIGEFSQPCTCTLNHLAITPDGKFLYVNGNGSPEQIFGYIIDQFTGSLSNISGSPFTTGITNMEALLTEVNSKFIYSVASGSGGVIIGMEINPTTGNLTGIAGSPFTGTFNNFRAVMHPSGKYLYTVNIAGAQLAKHDINPSDGSLSSANSILSFGSNLQFVTLDPTGAYGFVNNTAGNNFYQFKVDGTTGVPSLLNSGNPYSASATPNVPEPFRIAQ
ncbi:lactonase family protein [Leptospira jelokensis]|uniref:lactonase family protein n=1 Tax=Leptospira jelokensis TaxID=2484931 RepID=UPI0010917ED2|nr:beta-propeller fold lactonase family protein [Leptospira jelokensis]TGM01936.1 IPT/TIG domain protein [Leptospira jelokensis]